MPTIRGEIDILINPRVEENGSILNPADEQIVAGTRGRET